ncbi:metal ABC transporter ATP-binding protein [Caproicibacter fermentans]|uniref:metal ABC transporter ATP-binding protein n=1 Tax=Caproicibacter fermentans TaxID=2576756 RepID=UPI001E4EC3D5|nr:metal ABC transporter ATP-binding protein [Caproicibacter fermentans]
MFLTIQAKGLYFSYTVSAPYILDGIDFEIKDGDYISILGENGCGKSTLMKLILKLLKPTKGTIVTNSDHIGYVPQKNDFSNSNFPITVYEMLNAYRRLLKIKNKEAILEVLDRVGMNPFMDSLMGTLSGGQCQKIFIARALMGKPDLLILDEPSTGVDIGSQKEVYRFLKEINKKNGITIVSVEHNLDAAISNSTLIYHLSGGKGHLCTPEKYTAEFLKNEQ